MKKRSPHGHPTRAPGLNQAGKSVAEVFRGLERAPGEGDPSSAAFGHPGIPPRWTRSSKDGLGTAYNTASRVWFTLSHGVLNEVYFPTVDSPQIRDMEYLITDGETFFHEESAISRRSSNISMSMSSAIA